MTKQSPRQMAMMLLHRMEQNNAYSNIVLDSFFSKESLNQRDRDYITQLFYGVLERKITLDYMMSNYIKINKTQHRVLIILRMAFYELVYLNAKDYAVVNEYVDLAKAIGLKNAVGFINAVLRSFIRDDKKVKYPLKSKDKVNYLRTLYSCSSWIVDELIRDYGFETADMFLKQQLYKPSVAIRVNTTKIGANELIFKLKQDGIEVVSSKVPNCLIVKSGNVIKTKAFADGLFHVQDISSQLCSLVVSYFKPSTVLDVCSAPGGKAFTIAEETNAKILACDLYPKRVGLIEKGIKRLGLSNNIDVLVHDAKTAIEKQFDLVLCDVPCSGFGVMRRKPEIKYKKKRDVDELKNEQYAIICEASKSVKCGGYLVYSTCTLRKYENEDIVNLFLSNNCEFEICHLPQFMRNYFENFSDMLTMISGELDCDGFFLTILKRKI